MLTRDHTFLPATQLPIRLSTYAMSCPTFTSQPSPTPGWVRSVARSVLVLSVRSLISRNTCPQCTRGRGSVLLGRQCSKLCTSGLADDVMFSRNREIHIQDWSVRSIELFIVTRQVAPGAKSAMFCGPVSFHKEELLCVRRRSGSAQGKPRPHRSENSSRRQ